MSKYKWLFLIVSIAVIGGIVMMRSKSKVASVPTIDKELKKVVVNQYKNQGKSELLRELRALNCYHDPHTGETYAYAGNNDGYVRCVAKQGKGITERLVMSMQEVIDEIKAMSEEVLP